MHELSIAQSLVDSVVEELAARGIGPGRLRIVRLAAGRMQGIVADSLQFAWDVLIADTPAAGAALVVREVPILVRCKACGVEGGIEWPLFRCGGCGGGDLEIVEGRELQLESMEIDEVDPPSGDGKSD